MSNKINASNSNRLKHLIDSDQNIDDKFESFYEAKREQANKDKQTKPEDEPIDFKELYETHIAPTLDRFVSFVNTAIVPHAKKMFRAIHNRVGVAGWSLGAIGVVLVLLVLNIFGGAGSTPVTSDSKDVQAAVTGTDVVIEPTFEVLRAADTADIRFDNSLGVASYADAIQGTSVVVSQQQITPEQALDDLFLLEIAQSFNIQTEFQTEKGPIFIGENREQNVQTAIFTYESLLVFIQLQDILQSAEIIQYVNTIQ